MNKTYPQNFKELIKPIQKQLIVTVLLAMVGTISLLIAPIAVTVAIHQYLLGSSPGFIVWIVVAGVGIVLKQLLHSYSIGYAHVVEAKFRYRLRKDFSDKLSRLPLGFFSQTSSGAIRKFISEDTIKIHTIIAHFFSDFTAGTTLPIACAITMLIFEWRTALMILAAAFLMMMIGGVWMSIKGKGLEEISDLYENVQRKMSHSAIEMVDGIKEIKNFGIAGSLFQRFDDSLREFSEVSFEWLGTSAKPMSFIMSSIQPTMMLFLSLGISLFTVSKGWLSPEYAILFMLLSINLPSSLMQVLQLFNLLREGKHSVNNLLELYAREDQSFNDEPQDFVVGDIVFDDVSFSYDGKNEVLRNISCTMEQGKLTALVGASGGGKTTMARLVARFWDTSKGAVTIGGVNVKQLSEQAMLSNISIVFQDIAVMNASIADNIGLSKPNASREEIVQAAKSALIHDRIMRLPNGYDSVYGDENVVLSGGERQRLTIARAFLADTPIILLDEATAQADAQSEVQIQKALSELSKDKTVVMIAHRLSSIVGADAIFVLDGGDIVQKGTHETLLKEDGMYRDMWLAQSRKKGGE